ncbi:MAG: DnaD domain protein [Bacilli bacterium]|nr:DnaD domain protein [Bacilli bacterium]
MENTTLLPADRYVVINKSILSDTDRSIVINLYEPLIGSLAVSLYFTLWNDLSVTNIMSTDLIHHHLMVVLKSGISSIKIARESLEAFGLLKSYVKNGSINDYIYELYSPLTPQEFFNHPILNIVLYNNVGEREYENLKMLYKIPKIDLREYTDITKKLDDVYDTSKFNLSSDLRDKNSNSIMVDSRINFDEIIASIPKNIINEKAFTKKTKELINNLSFIYNIDTLKMTELIRSVLNEFGNIDKNGLRIVARKDYQFKNGTLPTLIYRTQPDYLKNPLGDNSKKGRIINVFENTTPYDFLRHKNQGAKPTARDLKLLEKLVVDLELPPAVVNVLIDYVLRKNNNRLTGAYVETIAAQWKRAGLKTASEAMEFAEKEHKKMQKKEVTIKKQEKVETPIWFDKKITDDGLTEDEENELKDLLKEFN